MHDDTAVLVRYAVVASVAAAALFYVLGPSLIPDEEYKGLDKHGTVGLSNAANDCFINSVLQALASSQELRDYLARVKGANDEENEDAPTADVVTSALHSILQRLNDPAWKGKTTSGIDFIRALESAFKSRISRQQQDAHELLQFVLQKVDDEHVARVKANQGEARMNETLCLPFQGRLESQIECTHCHYQPPSKPSDFLVLSLNVPQQRATSLNECLDGLLKQEVIEDFVCSRCKVESVLAQSRTQMSKGTCDDRLFLKEKIERLENALHEDEVEQVSEDILSASPTSVPKRKIARHTRIASYPQLLILHLSRSVYGGFSSKNTASVQLNDALKMGLLDRQDYRLVSIVAHKGGHNSGHYETFRRQTSADTSKGSESSRNEEAVESVSETKDPQRKKKMRKRAAAWWGISDAKVREYTTADVLAKQKECYMLLYEKEGPRP